MTSIPAMPTPAPSNPSPPTPKRAPVPRGLRKDGPVLFSYGFRPFFLGAALFAIVSMGIWLTSLAFGFEPGGSYGASHWHAHEMLFGFAPAVLAGFLLTAIPNWTGRLPVAGLPLMLLSALWLAGRAVMIDPDRIGLMASVAIDSLFLPTMLLVALREVIAGRKWKDLKVVAGLLALSLANLCFHRAMISGDHPGEAIRLSISAYAVLVMIIGGRIIPSFTRNFMAKDGRKDAPAPFGPMDRLAILLGVAALGAWVYDPDAWQTSVIALAAALAQTHRLSRWKGVAVWKEKLLFVLHAAYLFIPLGLLAIAAGGLGLVAETTVLHVLTIGVISTMMLAVMTRATRGHTGRHLVSSRLTRTAYALLFAAAVLRPLADLVDGWESSLLYAAGLSFMGAFILFAVEHAPMLAFRQRKTIG